MNEKILFLNIGWMKYYRGIEDGDEILGGGKYVNQNGFGHEIFNFQPVDGKMYGFVEPKTTSASAGRNSLHIEKIDKSYSNKDLIDGVLVVWTASRPNAKGNFIVGWYKNATIYRNERFNIEREFRGEKFGYFITADEKDCVLVPEDYRTKEIYRATSKGEGWMGQSNIWYANHPNVAYFRQEIFDYINENSSSINNIRNKFQPNPEIRKPVETALVDHSKKDLDIKKPSKIEVEYYLKKWDTLENYTLQESSLTKLFTKTYPLNVNLDDVLIKVCSLNDFYSTNIFSPYTVAKHIVDLKIDDKLLKKDLSIVNKIALVKMSGGKIKNFYSFATKYCSHHNPLAYPIYDSYVEKMLIFCKNKDGFGVFNNEDLKSYELFKDILFKFRNYYELESFDLKQIDKYLWLAGKRYFPKDYGKRNHSGDKAII